MANTIKDLINQGYTVEQIAAMAEKEAAAKKASEENLELTRARKTVIKAAIDYMIVLGVLDAEDIKKMIESEFDLTLFTCTSDSQDRITVRLNRVS